MEMTKQKMILFLLVAAMAIMVSACALGNRLELKTASGSDLTGNFNVIFYGCNYSDDLETIVILSREDSPYVFEPFAPDFNYRVFKGIPANDALKAAREFVACHTAFHKSQLSRLVDSRGETLGFEVRPLYYPFVLGFDDVLDTDYRVKDGKVVVKIRLLPSVIRMLGGGGADRDRD